MVLCGLMALLTFGLFHSAKAQSERLALTQAAVVTDALPSPVATSPSDIAIASPTWQSNFDAQAAQVLREEDNPAIRTAMLNSVIIVATQHPTGIDLSATVGALLQVCKDDPDKQQRLMAIQALHAIGPEHALDQHYHRAMEHLYRIMQEEPSDQVRGAAAALVHNFFAAGEET